MHTLSKYSSAQIIHAREENNRSVEGGLIKKPRNEPCSFQNIVRKYKENAAQALGSLAKPL